MTLSNSDYPTQFYATHVLANNSVIKLRYQNQTVTSNDLKKSIFAISIYYNDLREMIIDHKIKMVPSDLLAQIGGYLSLFLGMSLMTFIEFIEMMIQSVIILFKKF